MKLGFALSPGGLLLPYHMGVLGSLQQNGYLTDDTPVAGASAGAIASMAYGCGLKGESVLEATISLSDTCQELGGARGRLLPLLEEKMNILIGEEEFHVFQNRDVRIAYQEVFPRRQSFLESEFESRQMLFKTVSWSCMFPFFATNWPCAIDTSTSFLPRLVVDGFFCVPRDRMGCPDFGYVDVVDDDGNVVEESNDESTMGKPAVDRTIAICPFPKKAIRMDAFDDDDCITPSEDSSLEDLFRLATTASSREELTKIFKAGWDDGDSWCRKDRLNEKKNQQ